MFLTRKFLTPRVNKNSIFILEVISLGIMSETSKTIQDLPNEILIYIFDHLQRYSLDIRSVCYRWMKLVTKYTPQKSVEFPSKSYNHLVQLFPECRLSVKVRDSTFLEKLSLQNVHTLDLSSTQVTDVSALGNVHTLNLSSTQVTDVSALGNVHTLNLSFTQVADVSALGNVHTLNLCNTPVSDVSALGNVHTLIRQSLTSQLWVMSILWI